MIVISDDKKRVAEKVIEGISRSGGTCEGCGASGNEIDIFKCENCGAPICTNCHVMTDDYSLVCKKCSQA